MIDELLVQPNLLRKSEGFNGQRAIVLPDKVIKSFSSSALISNIFITDIGFYPKAKFHYREREKGIADFIDPGPEASVYHYPCRYCPQIWLRR